MRPVTPDDAACIAGHRHRMFVEAGRADDQALRATSAAFAEWVVPKLHSGEYFGWFIEDAGRVVAGLGMMLIDWPPHPLHLQPRRGYLLNVYTEPSHRGQGLARRLTRHAQQEAVRRGVALTILHATAMGRPLYEQLGFVATGEMHWLAPPDGS